MFFNKNYLLIFLLNFNFALGQFKEVVPGNIQEKVLQVPSLVELIKKDISDASVALKDVQDFFKNINLYIKKASYKDSFEIAIDKQGSGGIFLNFGYSGCGDLTKPFTGFETEIDFVNLADWLDLAFKNSLVLLGFDRFIHVKPQDEFLIKLVLLCVDKKNNIISSQEFITELFFLFYRLAKVETFVQKDFDKIFDNVFFKIISGIKIGKISLKDYLNKFWNNFNSIVNYDFKLDLKPAFELTKQDLIKTSEVNKIVMEISAIGLKTAIEHKIDKENYLNNTKIKLKGFLRRIIGIRKNFNKINSKIKPILQPFFNAVGLPYDVVFPKFEDLGDISQIESLYQQELAQDQEFEDLEQEQNFDFADF
ncbi:MAG: hypothetical protein SZ59_C0001G0041 [candidate division TM6 bacterium GW2011_GWF2_28_16]|nr:MAG: hypothetical protein SZ59_C0001G0041 [candidate division TM6 bacterium GW2011_GWF2_28_16]